MSARRGDDKGKELKVQPFRKLAALRDVLVRDASDEKRESPPSDPPAEAAEQREPAGPEDDENAFVRAMEDVEPLEAKRRVPPSPRELNPEVMDEVAQVNAYLRDLVDGVLPFDIADTDEYIEGCVQGLDHRLVKRLRRGDYSVQDHLDLHGLNRNEARAAVGKFIKESHARGLRCVLVVHGRGLRSKDQIPVLKVKLKAWLTRGSIGTKVLAFSSARPYDGGAGAAYVLLRR